MTTLRRRALPRPRPADDEGRMSLGDHLRELRNRIFKSALAVVAASIVGFVFYNPIFNVLEHPYCALPKSKTHFAGGSDACHLYFFHPLDAFAIRLRVAIMAGVLLSAPIWLYQLWRFITPGLKKNERKWGLTFVGASTALFAAGASMAYFMLTHALVFLLGAVGNNAEALLGVDQYLKFVTTLLTIFGLSFELPLVLVILNLAGLLSAKRMAAWRRPAIFGLFCFAGVATPSGDPFTMSAMGAGLAVLYEGAVLIAKANDRQRARRQAAVWAALNSADPAAALLHEQPSEHLDDAVT